MGCQAQTASVRQSAGGPPEAFIIYDQVGYWCPLIDTSICCDVADAGTQFAVSP